MNMEVPSTPISLSIRKNITRSRNGCAVCKSKRLKCDEAKPACSRCERLGIPCPGYKKPLKWTTASRSPASQTNTPRPGLHESSNAHGLIGYTFEQSPRADEPINYLDSPNFSELFTDLIHTDSAAIDEPDSQESPSFSFMEPLEAAQQLVLDPRPGPSTDSVCHELNENELWQGGLVSISRPSHGSLDRRASPARFSGSRSELPLSRTLQDHSSILIEYYFKEVCGLMSCYDSQKNPYRTAVSNVWSESKSLYYIIQSMSAACLSEVSPTLSNISHQLRDTAVRCLSTETTATHLDTSSLLAVVMLGMSLSWHDPSSLGESEFELLAKTLFSSEMKGNPIAQADKQRQFFFYNSLTYWRMLLSFVTDQDLASPAAQDLQLQRSQSITKRWEVHMPHPQTGIGIEVQELVAQVGSLVRRERKRIRSRRYSSRQDIEESQNAIQAAEELHSKLCAIDLPAEAAIADSGDEMTPTPHLLKIAEAYRCTGLLQLYRNFPDLLSVCSLLRNSEHQPTWLGAIGEVSIDPDFNPALTIDTWSTCLALHVLDLVQDVPESSRSRSIQPFLLVSICSELSLGRSFCPMTSLPLSPVASLASSPRITAPPTIIDILQARRSIVSRLSCFENILAAKPIRQMLVLIKDTWAFMDEKQEDVYWMDVMIEKGHETLMG